MKTGLFHSIVKIESLAAILLLLTILLVIAQQTLTRELSVDPKIGNWTTHCSDDRANGGKSFTEDLSSSDALSFSYRTQDNDQISYAIFRVTPPYEEQGGNEEEQRNEEERKNEERTLDLNWFTEVKIRARAEGEEKQQFLIYIRDQPAHFVSDGDPTASKYNEAFIELSEQTQSISLPRDCFVVPRWWVTKKSVVPQDAATSFSNVKQIEIAVCHPNQANSGLVVIEEISIRGPLISPINFYKLLFCIWSLLSIPLCVSLYASIRKAIAIRKIRRNQVALQESGSRADMQATTAKAKSSDTKELLRHDELTGLLTSFGSQEAIDEALKAVRNGNAQANIILVDIDDMDVFNRTSGMSAGDALIRQIAGVIETNLPEGNSVCRWKDDKFLIVCHGNGRDESRKLACALRKCIDEETSATCSFGVHQLNPINSFEEAYERASKCVQEAKFNGKNKVVLFNLRSTMAPIPNDAASQVSQINPPNAV